MSDAGVSTPVSSTSTLSIPPSPPTKFAPLSPFEKGASKPPSHAASTIIEYISSRTQNSSTVFVYDLAEHAGFGTLVKEWANATASDAAPAISLQTRDGAGLSLVGRLSQGPSKDASISTVLTAFTTPTGLASMAQSLTYLPPASPEGRLVLQVPAVTPVGESFVFTPSLASLAPALSVLQDKLVVLLSATPQESVELAALTYQISDAHVAHVFDQHSSAREIGHIVVPASSNLAPRLSLDAALSESGYGYFDYAGDNDAHTVVVLPNGPLALAAKAYATRIQGLGVVSVRVLRPWNEDALRAVLPAGVKRVHVIDDVPAATTQGPLYVDVLSALLDPAGSGPSVRGHRIVPTRTAEYARNPQAFFGFLHSFVPASPAPSTLADAPSSKKLLFFGIPGTPLSAVPHIIQDSFFSSPSVRARLLTDIDVFSRKGGLAATRLLLSSKQVTDEHIPAPVALPIYPESRGEADFIAVFDHALLKTHSLLEHAKPGSAILVVTTWAAAEFVANLPHETRELIHNRKLRIYALDATAIATELGVSNVTHEAVQAALVHLAFLRLYLAGAATEKVVRSIAQRTFSDRLGEIDLAIANAQVWAGLVEIELPAESPEVEAKPTAFKHFQFNAVAVKTDGGDTVVNGARLTSWHDAAKYILFSSAFTPPAPETDETYPQIPALHPEIPDRTFLITTTVNRRLTPLEYDRNVFHLEFDTSGTGLKYEIGEALGVHGWNDEQEVLDFCAWYGVDPNRLITLPVPGSEEHFHTRTVFQALQQQVDLFGRPGKSFYTALAEYATKPVDRYALLFIGAPEGASTFKKLGETETVTFADVLMRYPSARPGIEVLCQLIGDIKPRHYSIASSQAVVGDRVDLLVVAVDWVVPNGSPRYGQCTRYLAGLRVGQKVTVSIKPSVMKLPPDHMQPLILAGLGTGAAPFRAFLQHRAWLSAQNIPVGPVYYYFGSRHQSQEYLYGEEIEAFILDGTITKAGLAFSRDGARKVYIQHKMLEDGEDLARMLDAESGVFYLCGPTWPVGDIYEALVNSLVKFRGKEPEAAAAYLEELKEEERYVLEVY